MLQGHEWGPISIMFTDWQIPPWWFLAWSTWYLIGTVIEMIGSEVGWCLEKILEVMPVSKHVDVKPGIGVLFGYIINL